jgi:hypothetical protein
VRLKGEKKMKKKFVTETEWPSDDDLEIVRLRQEETSVGTKICLVSQPPGLAPHTFLMAYILDGEFRVVPAGIEERGLELKIGSQTHSLNAAEYQRTRNARDKWKSRAERSEREVEAKRQRIVELITERDEILANHRVAAARVKYLLFGDEE